MSEVLTMPPVDVVVFTEGPLDGYILTYVPSPVWAHWEVSTDWPSITDELVGTGAFPLIWDYDDHTRRSLIVNTVDRWCHHYARDEFDPARWKYVATHYPPEFRM